MDIISLILSFIFCALLMFLVFCIVAPIKENKPNNNKVHFYVARDKNGELLLYMSKPFRGIDRFHPYKNGCIITSEDDFSNFGLNKDDYANLKWEYEPIEVFLTIED